ncbi:L-fuculokinase [Streptomyces sp. NPDC059740]|uniref:FGGY-family carbohydrate kinase n=1 Tax=Streptomyces sp. NPDC059740 TaxID=3346926 RepID=UPI0036500A14
MNAPSHSTSAPLFAGVDVGSTHCKALLCDATGTVLARHQRRTPRGADGHTHPAAPLVAAALDALRACVRTAGRPPEAVGVTGMAEAGTWLDARGRPLHPVLAWSDPAPAPHAERLARRHGRTALHRATGVLPSAKVPLAKWCALAADHPQTLRRGRTWAGAADLVAHALTGQAGTDATFAQRTMAWDPRAGRWLPELLAIAGLDEQRMPTVHRPGTAVGHALADAATATGLRPGTPVVVAGHDHLVGAWAAGVREPGAVADSMGTAEAVLTLGAAAPDPARAAREGMSWGRAVDGRHWVVLAGARSSGALVEWFCDRFLGLAGAPGEERYAAFARLLATAPDSVTGLLLAPYPDGRACPLPDPEATLDLRGLRAHHGPADLARALLEGASHHARWMTETQAAVLGAQPLAVTLLGGSTRQTTWTALKAAVSPWPTRVCREPEAPAAGAAAWASAATGRDPAALRPDTTALTPDPATAAAYQDDHHRFLRFVTSGRTA